LSSSILVVGSVAFDSVKTPFGEAESVLGGSATYFSVSASFFSSVRVVAVVGSDFTDEHASIFKRHNVDTSGLVRADGQTFRWKGEYGFDLNEAHTLDTQLNVFETFKPDLPDTYRDAEYVFLGNIDPELQTQVLDQVRQPRVVACDTMNFWIQGKLDGLKKTLRRVDILVINDGETRMLGGEANLVQSANKIRAMGPKVLIVKRGEYGVLMFNEDSVFAAPAFPLEEVFDPTGAGDSFAGGFMGHLAAAESMDDATFRRAIVYGSVMASFDVEEFSLKGLSKLTKTEIEGRFRQFQRLTHFDAL
jgi:sugar/nucleoside kinase (ribokinase family)